MSTLIFVDFMSCLCLTMFNFYFVCVWYNISMKWSKIKSKLAKWGDEWLLAFGGLKLALKSWKFVVVAGVMFLFFGTLLNLLSSGFAAFNLMATLDFGGKMQIIFDAFLGIFGINKAFLDWLPIFCISLLQGALIGMIVLVWKKKRENSVNLQNTGIAAGLAILGSGCPTCGTSLIAPIIGALFSSGSYAVAGTISGIITFAAIIVALLAFKKVGEEVYVIIVSEKHKRRNS